MTEQFAKALHTFADPDNPDSAKEKPKTNADVRFSISSTEIANGVYEGTLNSLDVAVRKLPYSEQNMRIARLEIENHWLCDTFSLNILKSHGLELDKDKTSIYVCLETWRCSLVQAVEFCHSQGFWTDYLFPSQVEFESRHFSDNLVLWKCIGKPSPVLIKMVKGMISVIAALHKQKIYHRNLTAESFFLIYDGEDFIIKLDDLSLGENEKNLAIGTLTLVAPEQM